MHYVFVHIGVGSGKGETKCLDAVQQAITSPLLETSIDGASHVIINVSGDIGLLEANEAATYVQEMTGEDANIIFGAMMDEEHSDTVTITVIATGLEEKDAMSHFGRSFSTGSSFLGETSATVSAMRRPSFLSGMGNQPRSTAGQSSAPKPAQQTTVEDMPVVTRSVTPLKKAAQSESQDMHVSPAAPTLFSRYKEESPMSQSLSRRSFLRYAGTGAVTLAAALLGGVSAAAQDEHPGIHLGGHHEMLLPVCRRAPPLPGPLWL